MKHVRKRLTYANVMSSIAVFLVIGGGAAFAALGKNTVGTPQLKRNAVKVGKIGPEAVRAGKLAQNAVPTNRLRDNAVSTDKIGNLAVTSGKIADKAVTSGKIADKAVTSGKIADEAVITDKIAPDAVTGGKVDESTLGPVPDADKLGGRVASEYLRSPIRRVEAISANTTASGQFRSATANCPAGERAIAGGGMWTQLNGSPTGFNVLQGTRPVPSTNGTGITTGWQATGISDNAAERQVRAYVLCIPQ